MTKLSEEAREKASLKHAHGKTRYMLEQGRGIMDEEERENMRRQARKATNFDISLLVKISLVALGSSALTWIVITVILLLLKKYTDVF